MANIGVCIEPFFTDLPYRERIGKVKELGFKRYEFWFHNKRYDGTRLLDENKDLDEIAGLNARYGLAMTDFVFNHPDGGLVRSLIDPADRPDLIEALPGYAAMARGLGCDRLISGTGNRIKRFSLGQSTENIVETLRQLAPICEKEKVSLILEPFNSRVDHPDYFLDDFDLTARILEQVNSPRVLMLLDLYHMQIMAGNILPYIRENLKLIGHFHVAGMPGRHEPDQGELNYPFIIREIDRLGYTGTVGLEYWPTGDHAASLKRTLAWLS